MSRLQTVWLATMAIGAIGVLAIGGAVALSAMGRQVPSEITNVAVSALTALAALLPGVGRDEPRAP